jgi:hypothetical protein
MSARVDKIFYKVQRRIQSSGGKAPHPDYLLEMINDVHRSLITEHFILKQMDTLTTEAGTARYDLTGTVHKLIRLDAPSSWMFKVESANSPDEWEDIKRRVIAVSQPMYARVFDNVLEFYPSPTVTGDEVGIEYFRAPGKPLVLGGDPETPPEWDKAIEYGVMADITPAEWVTIFEMEVLKRKPNLLNDSAMPMVRDHWSKSLGF